jgi:hypothetical protein
VQRVAGVERFVGVWVLLSACVFFFLLLILEPNSRAELEEKVESSSECASCRGVAGVEQPLTAGAFGPVCVIIIIIIIIIIYLFLARLLDC